MKLKYLLFCAGSSLLAGEAVSKKTFELFLKPLIVAKEIIYVDYVKDFFRGELATQAQPTEHSELKPFSSLINVDYARLLELEASKRLIIFRQNEPVNIENFIGAFVNPDYSGLPSSAKICYIT